VSGLSDPVHLVLVVALVAFWVVPAMLVARLAQRKGRSFALFMIAGLLIGWLFDAIAAVLLIAARPSSDHA